MRWKWLVYLIILLGLAMIFSPYIKEQIINYASSHINQKKITADEIIRNNKREADFHFDAINPPSFLDTVRETAQIDAKAVVGRIEITSVGIDLPIMKGTTNANMLVGATTMRSDQKMGNGNYPLAGHYMRNSNLLFGPLMNIEVDDEILVTDLKDDYIYKVTSKKIISAKQSDIIHQTKETIITLITCDRPTKTDKRLAVQGKLIKVTKHEE